jgi:hypothetical protein
MANPARSLLCSAHNAWLTLIGRNRGSHRNKEVFLHDPEAEKPKNLDDPFHDAATQERVAKVIARAARAPED